MSRLGAGTCTAVIERCVGMQDRICKTSPRSNDLGLPFDWSAQAEIVQDVQRQCHAIAAVKAVLSESVALGELPDVASFMLLVCKSS